MITSTPGHPCKTQALKLYRAKQGSGNYSASLVTANSWYPGPRLGYLLAQFVFYNHFMACAVGKIKAG